MKAVVIQKGEKYFTFLKSLFKSINDIQREYNWLITGFECYPQNKEYAKKLSGEYCWITGDELTDMVEDEDFQWIWGVLSAFPKNLEKNSILKYKLPQAEGNTGIWQEPISIQHPFAEIEIVAWDSSKTIFISKNDEIIENLKNNNTLAEDFEKLLEW